MSVSVARPPAVRVSVCDNPEQVQPDVYIVGGSVHAALPVDINPVLEPLVKFYHDVPIRVACHREDCQGHFKYGVWEDRNLPVIFTNHKYEVAYYHAFVVKVQLPFPITDKTNQLMDGIQWYSASPNDGQIGMNNSCMIDGFLMDFKIRALDMSYCIGCLFAHRSGRGRMLERILRTIIHYIMVVSDPKMSPGGVCQVVRKFTYEQQLFVKRIWIDRLMSPQDLETEISIDRQGQVHQVHDLLRDPLSGRHMLTRMSMYRMVMGNLGPLCHYYLTINCGCGPRSLNKVQFYRFMAIDTEEGRFISSEPAFQTFDCVSLEFDGDYWNTGEGETYNTRNSDLNTSRRIDGFNCPPCSQKFQITGIAIPETTWLVIVEVPTFMRHDLEFNELPVAAVFGSHSFEITWVSFMARGDHFVSTHKIGGQWYYYDDLAGGRPGRECPLTRIEPDTFDHSQLQMQRVFYRRITETSPHRCIKRSCDEEVDTLMNV